ncbi:ICMT-domain-containing protein [Macrolepiota fuliginosa MF-IS2]|uniref:Protein-S-isoprenylcysteine O-methyltransferase n=1 Tax=Macrolepiota fuliginosa MF-IS2 TaxID=1400762 RepID=A0A9P6C4U3_9AGAR|nr:ICMT-domain-containing protein [Macrolepiota fuliginosa MF-IS2]
MVSDDTDPIEERLRIRAATQNHLHLKAEAADLRGGLPNTPFAVVTIAFVLGGIFYVSLLAFLVGGFERYWWSTNQLAFFFTAWSFFHWAEFAVTAGWNSEKCNVDSFLLNNGAMYHIAHATALSEYLITLYIKPETKAFAYVSQIGIILTLCGQTLRSLAMIHASTNFSHAVAFEKRRNHQLVTDGIYARFRHPSYAGFFYWALGTQLVLQNPLSFVLYCILLWRFFYYRTRAEEGALVKFFGQAYIDYRRRVGTKIPFIP